MADTTEEPGDVSVLVAVGVTLVLIGGVMLLAPLGLAVAGARQLAARLRPSPAAKLARLYGVDERTAEQLLAACDDDVPRAAHVLVMAAWQNITPMAAWARMRDAEVRA